MKILKIIFPIILLLTVCSFAQGTAGADAKLENQFIVDMPTAGVLKKGNVGTNIYLMPDGVLISRLEVGVFDNFSFGISYGAANFIGVGSPKWYKLPGVDIKVKIIEETDATPAIALGFDSQGKGQFFTKYSEFSGTFLGTSDFEVNRFKIKSPGFFASASKNFQFLGYLSLHGCMNYSLETDDQEKDLNFIIGAEKTIGSKISVVAEYDFAINDNSKKSLGDGNGYLNAGVRWSLGDGFTLGFDLRDLLSNKKLNPGSADRAIKVEFIKPIF
ncbi:MAG: YjbH domain-containing protein [Ignavibacteriales bacterium]|nr:YjbH domain-containing protein [Ignavibacteriales bacterium]